MSEEFLDIRRLEQDSFLQRVEFHRVLPSTNDHCLDCAGKANVDTPLFVVCEEQTAGRGRGNNAWWSGSGALTFSLLFDPSQDRIGSDSPLALRPEFWPRIALTAGLSLCEVLSELVPHVSNALKWPNDVLLDGKKVAGILTEIPRPTAPGKRLDGEPPGGGTKRAILGMGINVNNSLADAPAEIQTVGISLCDAAGGEFDLTEVLLRLLARLEENLYSLAMDDPTLAARWQTRCALRGRTITVQQENRSIQGLCRGIAADGGLTIDTGQGQEHVYGGVLVRTVG